MPTSAIDSKSAELPYGIADLKETVGLVSERPRQVRCFVEGCGEVLNTPRQGYRGEVCPKHGIRCHYSYAGATYSYRDAGRNIIASPGLFSRRIVRHPFKYESHRLGLEKSEDAVSWNVFRSFAEAGCLSKVAELITGESIRFEPHLYLWGICCSDDSFEPWRLLINARDRFESRLPVDRPLTEPDIALHLPGRFLILIEAKFTSPNTCYERGPRKDRSSLTLAELLGIYHDKKLRLLDIGKAQESRRIYYQLWRNTIFAEWMAMLDHQDTKAYHANLVREQSESESATEFQQLLHPEFHDRFRRITWEQLYSVAAAEPDLGRLCRYMANKTAGLKPAFAV
jgi:hypothetical protein